MAELTTDLIAQARRGDENAFEELVAPHRRDLQLHCYRILGSVYDAEDALQETLLAAWRGLGDFEERSNIRTWLYRVATNRCLNALRTQSRRPEAHPLVPQPYWPEPSRTGEVLWLEPYPDALFAGIADTAPGPEATYEAREAVSLAFITALQLLPPRQRAVLILRDVLGYRAAEVSQMLETTEESVTSALKRARATLQRELPSRDENTTAPVPGSDIERDLVERFASAFESRDVDRLVGLLTEDALLTMPPLPLVYCGPRDAARFLGVVFGRQAYPPRLVPTRANGQPAFGVYVRDPQADVLHGVGLLVVGLSGTRIDALTRFDTAVFPVFGLSRTLPA